MEVGKAVSDSGSVSCILDHLDPQGRNPVIFILAWAVQLNGLHLGPYLIDAVITRGRAEEYLGPTPY